MSGIKRRVFKLIKVLLINIVVIALYFAAFTIYLIYLEINTLRFEKLDYRYEKATLLPIGIDTVEVNGFKVDFENIVPPQRKDRTELNIYVNGQRLNRGPALNRHPSHFEVYLINMDRDQLKEIYLYDYVYEYNLIDFYEENGEVKYRLLALPEDTGFGRAFYLHKWGLFENSEGLSWIFFAIMITFLHLTIATLFIIFKVIKWILKKLGSPV